MTLTLIAAVSKNGVIGKNNKLPWKLPTDFKHFKTTTAGRTLLCGRKTYESIGQPLPGRPMVVVSRNKDYQIEGCQVEDSVDGALYRNHDIDVCIGGSEIYEQCMPLATEIIITEVDVEIEGDSYFPNIDANQWRLVSETPPVQNKDDEYAMRFLVYNRM